MSQQRDKKVVKTMIQMYCSNHHCGTSLCKDCTELTEYCFRKIDKCPLGSKKTNCQRCPIHCYEPQQREKIKKVMKYAGPRMTFSHPMIALRHIISMLRKA